MACQIEELEAELQQVREAKAVAERRVIELEKNTVALLNNRIESGATGE